MIHTKNEILRNSEIFSLMRHSGQAYEMMSDAQSKIATLNTMNIVFSIGLAGYVILGALTYDSSDKEFVTYLGVIFGIGAIAEVTFASLRSASFKDAKTAVDLYNNVLKTSSKLPKSELKFGFTTNGIGLRVNF
jgi:hypothetical protein